MGVLAALARHAEARTRRAAQAQLRTVAPEQHNGGVCRRCGCDWVSCHEKCIPQDTPSKPRTASPAATTPAQPKPTTHHQETQDDE